MEEGTGIFLIIYFVYFVFVKFIVVVVVDPGTVSDRAEVKFIFYWVCFTRVCTRVPVFSFPDSANCKACEIYLYFNYSWGIFVIYMMPWVLMIVKCLFVQSWQCAFLIFWIWQRVCSTSSLALFRCCVYVSFAFIRCSFLDCSHQVPSTKYLVPQWPA